MKSLAAKDFSTLEIYKILTGVIVPRPIALVSTINDLGQINAAPFSFFNGVCSNPPCLSISIARNQDGSKKDTLRNIEETGEFVVNTCSTSFAEQMLQTSNQYPYGVNELEEVGLNCLASLSVKAPRIKEAKAQLECKLHKIVEIGDQNPGSASLVIGEVVHVHLAEEVYRDGKISFEDLDILARVSGMRYASIEKSFALTVKE